MGKPSHQEFEKLYDAHTDELYRYCFFRTHDSELAKDMVQEVFLQGWNYMQDHEVLTPRPLFYRIARNRVIDWYRKKKSESLDNLMDEGFDPSDSRADAGIGAEINEAMKMLGQLSPEDQELITWKCIEELGTGEIAEMLQERENTVAVRIHRAIERLRKIADKK